MYDISDEFSTLVKIKGYFENARDYHYALVLEKIEKSLLFKFLKLFFWKLTPEQYYEDNKLSYEIVFVEEKTQYSFDVKLRRIETWLHAIKNNHKFTIDDYEYRLFMEYKSIAKVK